MDLRPEAIATAALKNGDRFSLEGEEIVLSRNGQLIIQVVFCLIDVSRG
ncbi:hypothetical protein [Okeania sp. KiyG1]|nr:hypothetical protein [Okeania sp. KiyG1]